MSDKNKSKEFFRNEDTLMRRAWIESALAGVRSSLDSGSKTMEFGEPVASHNLAGTETPTSAMRSVAAPKRPALYVAWSAGARRARS